MNVVKQYMILDLILGDDWEVEYPSLNKDRIAVWEDALKRTKSKIIHSQELKEFMEFLKNGDTEHIIFAVLNIRRKVVEIYNSYNLSNKLDKILDET